VSSDVSVAARNFAHFGVLQLGAVPVNNNPPIGPHDIYTHWPPLLPIILSWVFRLFGESESTAHLLMLVTQVFTALLICVTARDWLGELGGALAGIFWLTLPAVIHFGHLVAQQSLAILFMTAAVWLFTRSSWGALAIFLAAWSSWEAVLVVPGLWATAIISGRAESRTRAAHYTAAAAAAMLSVIGLYASRAPELFVDGLNTALFRMGVSHAYSSLPLLRDVEHYLGFEQTIALLFWNHVWMLGFFGLAAVIALLLSRPKGCEVILWGLGAPWLLWCALMRNQVAVHDFEMLLAAPLVSIALAWMAVGVIHASARTPRSWGASIVVVGLILLQPVVLGAKITGIDPNLLRAVAFSEGVKRSTSRTDIVLSPLISAAGLWYSERHIVRNVANDEFLQAALPEVRKDFPAAPLYLAVPGDRVQEFPHLLHSDRTTSASDVVVKRLQ